MIEHGRGTGEEIESKPIGLIVVKRISILFFLLFFLSLFYWAVGSFRSFLEETQIMLLDLLWYSSIALTAAAAVGVLASIAYLFLKRRASSLLGLLGYAVLIACGTVGLLLSDGLAILSRGVG